MKHSLFALFGAFCFFASGSGYLALSQESLSDGSWDTRFGVPPGLDGPVSSIATIGKNLYVAGDFKHAGSVAVEANGLACWNGQSWSALLRSSDFTGAVYTVAATGGDLLVGGAFVIPSIAATNIAKWNGSNWERLGDGVGQYGNYLSYPEVRQPGVFAIATKAHLIYVAGAFSQAGSLGATNVAVWDGNAWSALGAGLGGASFDQPLGVVNALALQGNHVYAGGIFHNSGSLRVTNVAEWDGRSWNSVGGGVSGGFGVWNWEDNNIVNYTGGVLALQSSGNGLYAGGYFTTAGATPVTNIAFWNGKIWSGLNGGINSDSSATPVRAIVAVPGGIVVGGSFKRAGTTPAQNIAQWNGREWSAVGAPFSGPAYALANGDALYAGGEFGLNGQTQEAFISRFDGADWRPLQPGNGNAVIGPVFASTAAHGKSYLVGQITSAGSLPVQKIVEWDGNDWNGVDGGVASAPYSAVVARSNLYLSGVQLPQIGATNFACWNGQGWSPLPGLDQLGTNAASVITPIAGDDTHLYVTIVPGVIPSFQPAVPAAPGSPGSWPYPSVVMAWDGEHWRELATIAAPSMILKMIASKGHLYVCHWSGPIPNQGPGESIDHWDGQNWQNLGNSLTNLGVTYPIIQMAAAVGDHLYVLVNNLFRPPLPIDLGSPPPQCPGPDILALWDGTRWQCLLGGDLRISGLAASARGLYVGGYFTEIAGVAANYVARFDNSGWHVLGPGLDSAPGYNGLSADENNLYVTGLFTTAGGNSSYHFGIWHEPLASSRIGLGR